MTVKELALVREAILATLDEPCTRHQGPWVLTGTQSSEDLINQERLDFCDAVQKRIAELSKRETR